MVASVVAAVGAGGNSGWQVSRQRVALWSTGVRAESHAWCGACGRDWKHAAAMGDGLKTWAAQVRQQATGRHASRQAGSVRTGRLCATGADWAMWLGAAELGLRPWWSGDGVRTGKSR